VEDLAGAALDPRVPLWQLHLVDGVGAGCALVLRAHHVLADGLALVDVLLGLTDEGPCGWTPASVSLPAGGASLRALLPLAGLAALALSRPEPRTSLTHAHHAHKRLAWSRPLDLAALKRAARQRSTGVTALLLATVAAGLREVLAARGELTPGLVVRAMVPLSLRAASERGSLGNRYASVFVGLPVGLASRDARVDDVSRRLAGAVVTGGVSAGRALVRVAGHLGASLERLGVDLLSRRASLVVSNVPGPVEARHIAGQRLDAVAAFAPVAGALGLGVTCVGYGGAVSIGVASGMDSASLPRELVDGVTREFEALTAMGSSLD